MDQSPFRGLSAELRNRIYEFVVTSNRPLYINGPKPDAVQPSITRVCKQIRDESLLLFYNSNSFRVCADRLEMEDEDKIFSYDMNDAHEWLHDTNAKCHESVASLEVRLIPEWTEPQVQCNREFRLFSKLLRDAGYRSPRLQVVVLVDRDQLSPWGPTDPDDIKQLFQDIGLDVTVEPL